MKSKLKLFVMKLFSLLFLVLTSQNAQADWSYGAKFLATTFGGCAVGYGAGYGYSHVNNYDSQPGMIVSWMGAATGCLSGALFSYIFYEDKTQALTARVSSDDKTIEDLKIQLARIKNATSYTSYDGSNPQEFYSNVPEVALQNPFENLGVTEVITQKMIDEKNLPTGFSSDTCSKFYNFYLTGDSTISTNKKDKLEFIAIDKNFALIGFQFAYSYDGCFKPSDSQNGKYFGQYWPYLSQFLGKRVEGLYKRVAKEKTEKAMSQNQ